MPFPKHPLALPTILLVIDWLVHASSCTGFNCSEVPQGPDMGLIIGVVLGVGAVLFTGTLLYIWWRRRRIRNWQRNYVDTARVRAAAQTDYEQQHGTVAMVEQHQQSVIAAQQREYDALQRQRDSFLSPLSSPSKFNPEYSLLLSSSSVA
ncbi:hypothetical protein BDZ89DRAFT_1032810 [Hymenopellis radicata]|nr:hypothetical protein BDZ89DRAFT_1032810 [Hymenopellis radicata]